MRPPIAMTRRQIPTLINLVTPSTITTEDTIYFSYNYNLVENCNYNCINADIMDFNQKYQLYELQSVLAIIMVGINEGLLIRRTNLYIFIGGRS